MSEINKLITINSRKFNYAINRSWKARLIEKTDSFLLFVGEFENEVNHNQLGVIRRGTISYEFYWFDRWYNIFRFHEPNGDFRNYYCNINLPPKFENDVLDYIDLDLDVLVRQDFSFQILDEDEFEENSKHFQYTEEVKFEVQKALDEIKRLIANRTFPFDYNF